MWTCDWHSAEPVRGTRANLSRSVEQSTLATERIRTP